MSQAAIDRAHTNPEVGKLWERYAACCDYVTLADLPEARDMFPGFALVTADQRSGAVAAHDPPRA